MFRSTRCTAAAAIMLTPFVPSRTPCMFMLRRVTVPPAALMLTALVAPGRMPPGPESQSMVMDLVMVTAPNPPGSRQSISPFTAVFEMAPANVLHGAVRLHGLASSPTPDTHVRDAWALATEVNANIKSVPPNMVKRNRRFFMIVDLLRLD